MESRKQELVTFKFSLPNVVKNVFIVGDFNHWKVGADPMQQMFNGTFQRTKRLLAGRYEYKFYADGVYWDDPQAIDQTINSFGTRNSVLKVG
jgi:1,4-alpha-glucan branching enzyme